MKTTRAFTLIELMVVVSIITMFASIVLASIQPIRAQARDAKRKQEIHQIDLAIQEYIADHGYPPEWDGCKIQVDTIDAGTVSGCLAVSTDSVDGSAWSNFIKEIAPYLKSVPTDPCTGSSCSSTGYTYAPPLVMQYYCKDHPCSSGASSGYQVLTSLENGSSTTGVTGGDVASLDMTPPSVPANITAVYTGGPASDVSLAWSPSIDAGGSGLAGYRLYRDDTFIAQFTNWSGTDNISGSLNTFCWQVSSIDNAGNESAESPKACVGAPSVTLTQSPFGTWHSDGTTHTLSWHAANIANPSCTIRDSMNSLISALYFSAPTGSGADGSVTWNGFGGAGAYYAHCDGSVVYNIMSNPITVTIN